jgi:S1-C subfamily serine protease
VNLVDLLIILLLVAAVFKGIQAGLLELILSFSGLLLGFLIGSRIAQLIAVHFSNQLAKFAIIMVLTFGLAAVLWTAGLMLSHRLRPHTTRLKLSRADEIAGGILEVLFVLIIIWMVASGLSNVGSYGIGHNIRHSLIIKQLNKTLPAPPDVIAQLEKIVSPNGFPNVFLGFEPQHTTISPKNSVDNQAILADEKSVVKVQGIGCGALVYGSGFVAAKNLVITNAHVIAGISRPQVVDATKTYQATPVFFDPKLDIAILKVNNLTDPPLNLSSRILPDGDAAATLGFPLGAELAAEDAVIIDYTTAIGRDIYNKGIVKRDIYEVQTNVQQGDSGSPLLAPDGSVVGVMFAKSVAQDNLGYALLFNQVQPVLNRINQNSPAVTTGHCVP